MYCDQFHYFPYPQEATTAAPTVTTDHDVAYTVISTETHGRKSTKNGKKMSGISTMPWHEFNMHFSCTLI